MKKCPYCAEEIQDEAIVCRYCGRDLLKPSIKSQPANQQAQVQSKKNGNTFYTLIRTIGGFFVILCFLGICIVAAMRALGPNTSNEVEPTQPPEVQSNVVISTFSPVPVTETPSPTKTLRPSATPNIGVIGESREAGGIELTVLNVTNMERIDFLTADPGYIYLVLDVTIENVGRDNETPYNPFYFSVKDKDGYEYNPVLLAPNPSLKSGDLPFGEMVRGFVAFEIRSAAEGLVVTYEPIVILGGYEPIRVSLEKILTIDTSSEMADRGPCEFCNFECPEKQGEFEFCIADPELVVDTNLLESTVDEYCNTKGTGFCKLLIWTDINYLPTSLPMTDLQVGNQMADYTRNITTGNDCLKLLSSGSVIYSSNGCK